MPTLENVWPRFVKKKTNNLSGGLPQAGIQRTFGRSGTLCGRPSPPSEGPHRPARATLRRVSFLFCAANAFFSSLHRPQNLVFFGKAFPTLFDRDFIQRVRDAVSLPDLIGVTIAWNLKAENTNAFVPSTMTRSPLWASMNGMASGGTNALPAVRVGTASHT